MDQPFRRAVIAGDALRVEASLAAGTSPDGRDGHGQTALMLAALHGHDAVVELLLTAGAEPDVTAKFGLSALMLAVVNHHESIARRLVEAGADTSLAGTGTPGFAGKTACDLAEAAGLDSLAACLRGVSR